MASESIEMRVHITGDPKVIAMGRYLAASARFQGWALGHSDGHTDVTRDHGVTGSVTRVTDGVTEASVVLGLLRVWGVTRRDGVADGVDIRLACADLATLDRIAGVPDFGLAMAAVHWVEVVDGDQLVFPKLLNQLRSTGERKRAAATERKRRQRERERVLATESPGAAIDGEDGEDRVSERHEGGASGVTESVTSRDRGVPEGESHSSLLEPVPVPVTGESRSIPVTGTGSHGANAPTSQASSGDPGHDRRTPIRKQAAVSLEQRTAIAELRELTGELGNDGFYCAIVTQIPEVGVRRLISELRAALNDPGAPVRHPGRLLTSMAKRIGADYGAQVFGHQQRRAA